MKSLHVMHHRRWLAVLLAMAASAPAVAQVKQNAWPVPRHAVFTLDAKESQVSFSLFAGGAQSRLTGSVRLFLGDPSVPAPMDVVAGWVGLSVDGASLIAVEDIDHPALPNPLRMIQDPRVRSTGLWNLRTSEIRIDLYLTTPQGLFPVPQPVYLTGFLALYTDAATVPVLRVEGSNGNIPDGQMNLTIRALEAQLPPPGVDIWFSTETGFTSGSLNSMSAAMKQISDGDLLSRTGQVVRRNGELTGKLGIMPMVPPLGLDAVMVGPQGTIWFSFEETTAQIWSETLATWLKHGDLLSESGKIVRTNEQLLEKFVRMPPVADAGLDAVARAPNGSFLFSTEVDFFSQSLGTLVRHGDLLSDRGVIVMRNEELLRNFKIHNAATRLSPVDYGLDAVILRSNTEIWFSTEIGFQDARFGLIDEGDLLSTDGYVVARNLDLVAAFGPVEDVASFGLDAAAVAMPVIRGDLDLDGDVDQSDFGIFQASLTGPPGSDGAPNGGDPANFADLDGDGQVDLNDFGVFQRCIRGPGMPAADDEE